MGKQLSIKGADFSVNCIEDSSANLLKKSTIYYNAATASRKRSMARFFIKDVNDFSITAVVSEDSPYKAGLQARNSNLYPYPSGFFSLDKDNPSSGMPPQSIYDSGWTTNGATKSITNETVVSEELTDILIVFTDIATSGSSANSLQTAEELSRYIKIIGHNITTV